MPALGAGCRVPVLVLVLWAGYARGGDSAGCRVPVLVLVVYFPRESLWGSYFKHRRAACVRFQPCRVLLLCAPLQGAAAVCAWVLVAPLYALRRLGAGGARAARVPLLCALRSLGAGAAAAASACYEARAKKPRELERNDSNAIWGLCWRNLFFSRFS